MRIIKKYLTIIIIGFITTIGFNFLLLLIINFCKAKPDGLAIVITDIVFLFLIISWVVAIEGTNFNKK